MIDITLSFTMTFAIIILTLLNIESTFAEHKHNETVCGYTLMLASAVGKQK